MTKVTRARRLKSPVASAASSLYEVGRRRYGCTGQMIGEEFVKRQLQRFGHKSAISGRTNNLRLRRFWPDLPLGTWNAVVVTSSENRMLSLTNAWLNEFPPELASLMKSHRMLVEIVQQETI